MRRTKTRERIGRRRCRSETERRRGTLSIFKEKVRVEEEKEGG